MNKSIMYLSNKIKLITDFVEKRDIFIVLLIILTCLASFGLGRLSKIEENKTPLEIDALLSKDGNTASVIDSVEIKDNYVASKTGTKYHLPWCSGAQTIKESNKIWFKTKEEAESRGYSPAKNCKGI